MYFYSSAFLSSLFILFRVLYLSAISSNGKINVDSSHRLDGGCYYYYCYFWKMMVYRSIYLYSSTIVHHMYVVCMCVWFWKLADLSGHIYIYQSILRVVLLHSNSTKKKVWQIHFSCLIHFCVNINRRTDDYLLWWRVFLCCCCCCKPIESLVRLSYVSNANSNASFITFLSISFYIFFVCVFVRVECDIGLCI